MIVDLSETGKDNLEHMNYRDTTDEETTTVAQVDEVCQVLYLCFHIGVLRVDWMNRSIGHYQPVVVQIYLT